MQNLKYIEIKNSERYKTGFKRDETLLGNALNAALEKIDRLIEDMDGKFPDHNSINNVYMPVENNGGWNTGFWCGILWLAYEATEDEKYRQAAERLLPSFYKRIDEKLGVNTHDLGFIYVPSCVAAYKLTGNERAKKAALDAADHLMTRYNEKGKFIQAWGEVGDNCLFIVDCMNNIPLLFWASEVTGDKKYYEAAYNHAQTTIRYAIREDASSYHTYTFTADGKPLYGKTEQGATDDSCWARGQSWLVNGLPNLYRYVKSEELITLMQSIANYFLSYLPADFVPYWDLSFKDGDGEDKDSSAGAIAACGLIEMLDIVPDANKATYSEAVDRILSSLYENYSTKDCAKSNGLLLHAVYAKPFNNGVDECNIWGCYYYMEALVRMIKGTKAYW